MSKRNKRRFFQSQNSHLDYLMSGFKDIDLWDYHMEVYRRQRKLRKILSESEKSWIYVMEVDLF